MTQGFLSNVLNPEVALFIVVLVPQFVQPHIQNQTVYMEMMGLLFAPMTITLLALLGILAGTFPEWLQRKGQAGEWIGGLSVMVLVLLGLGLPLPQAN